MIRLEDFAGGRALVNNDIQAIQDQIDRLFLLLGEDPGPFVVSGCEATLSAGTVYDFAAGKIHLEGRIVDFEAQQIDLATGTVSVSLVVEDVIPRLFKLLSVTKTGGKKYTSQVTSAPQIGRHNLLIMSDGWMRRISHAYEEIVYKNGMLIPFTGDVTQFVSGGGRGDMASWEFDTDHEGRILVGVGEAGNLGNFLYESGVEYDLFGGGQGFAQATMRGIRYIRFKGTSWAYSIQ